MSLNYEVPAEGPTDAQIVLIGEAPASEEFSTKRPFRGSAGTFLTNLLGGAGLQRENLFITNVSKERAPQNKMANMPYEALKLWEQDLLEEINLLSNPKVLVPMGNYALQAVAGRSGVTKLRGSVLPPTDKIEHDCVVVPTFHPSKLHYDYKVWPLISADFIKIKELAEASEPFKFPEYHFTLQPTFDQTMKFFDMLETMEDTLMTFDIETPHGLLSCFCVAWSRSEAFCLPFFWGDGRNYWSEEEELLIWKRLAELLPKLNLANQNVAFDWKIMLEHGIRLKMPTYDSMLMHACLYSELPHKLEVITSIYTHLEFYKLDEKEEKGSALRAGDELNHWKYNCLDGISTLWAIEELIKELIEEDMMEVYISLYAEMIEPLFLMNQTGVRLNLEHLAESRKEMTAEAEKLDNAITLAAGHEVNVNSPKQVATLLYDEFCFNIPKLGSKSSARPTGVDALEKLAYQYKIDAPLQIRDARSHKKLLSLFKDENLSPDGRLRCTYTLTKTKSGRLNSVKQKGSALEGKGMNLQNVKTSGPARSFFIAEEGHVLLGADQEGADARIVAWLSQDEKMIALFSSGVSIHIQNAKNVFGKDIDKDDPLYKISKSLVHAGNYGIGPWGFAYAAGIPFAEAKQNLALYHSRYPGIQGVFHQYVKDELREKGMLFNPFGRRQVFFGRLDDTTYRAGYSFIPQSTISDINKTAMKKVYRSYLPVLELHDNLIISVHANDIKGGKEALKDAYDIKFKIWNIERQVPISLSQGDNWRDMVTINE